MKAFYYLALLLPVVLSVLAWKKDKFSYQAAATYSGIGLILLLFAARGVWPGLVWWLVFALGLSILGDYLMRRGGNKFFLLGVLTFSLAEVCYLVYGFGMLKVTAIGWIMTVLLASAVLYYLFVRVMPGVKQWYMVIPFVVFAVLSGAIVGTAFGIGAGSFWGYVLYLVSMAMIVGSDICIAEDLFAGNHKMEKWVMPLYYAAHVALVAHVMTMVL